MYQVDDDNEATQVAKTTGVVVGDCIEVFGQLVTGLPVVLLGTERLRPGQKSGTFMRSRHLPPVALNQRAMQNGIFAYVETSITATLSVIHAC